MKVLITGAGGQLGQALQKLIPGDVIAAPSSVLDITDAARVATFVREAAPDVLINAAAYTAVDRAENEADTAYTINADAVGYLAKAAADCAARFVHVSTDFVFDGQSGRPWRPDDTTGPLGVYGASKLRGEELAGDDALIVRTAWVYGLAGNNFVHTMLRLMAERDRIGVVCDQIGTPTCAASLADGIWRMIEVNAKGVFHYTDSGVASWYDFAVAIQEEALQLGLLDRAIPIEPISTSAYPTPARRPSYSVLDKQSTIDLIGRAPSHWRVNLRHMLRQLLDTRA